MDHGAGVFDDDDPLTDTGTMAEMCGALDRPQLGGLGLRGFTGSRRARLDFSVGSPHQAVVPSSIISLGTALLCTTA